MEKLVRWLIKKFLPGMHLGKNPVRKGTKTNVDVTNPQIPTKI